MRITRKTGSRLLNNGRAWRRRQKNITAKKPLHKRRRRGRNRKIGAKQKNARRALTRRDFLHAGLRRLTPLHSEEGAGLFIARAKKVVGMGGDVCRQLRQLWAPVSDKRRYFAAPKMRSRFFSVSPMYLLTTAERSIL